MEEIQLNKQDQTFFQVRKPSKYNVIMHNDDYTTMDFVVMVLKQVFCKSPEEAERLMMKVHQEGQAIVGTYYRDMAESKAKYTMGLARANGFPLKLTTQIAQ